MTASKAQVKAPKRQRASLERALARADAPGAIKTGLKVTTAEVPRAEKQVAQARAS